MILIALSFMSLKEALLFIALTVMFGDGSREQCGSRGPPGFGHVHQALARLLLERSPDVQVLGIATATRGVVAKADGLDLAKCLEAKTLHGLGEELEDAEAVSNGS